MNEEKNDTIIETNDEKNMQQDMACNVRTISIAEYEQCEKVKKQLEYLTADFENYKRRSMLEIIRATKEGQRKILLDIISIVDDFDCALAAIQKSEGAECSASAHVQGFTMMHRACIKILDRHNVKEIVDMSIFDPNKHEAVMQVSNTELPSGTIVEVFEKGYLWNDELLRVAKVSVAA